jgi:hypothetical protein
MTVDAELGDLSRLSRVELEPVLERRVEVGDMDGAAIIAEELEARTWQNLNPYADGVVP